MKIFLHFILLSMCCCSIALGQIATPVVSWRLIKIAPDQLLWSDSLTIDPLSVSVSYENTLLPPSAFTIQNQRILLHPKASFVDSITLIYRVLPFNVELPMQRLDSTALQSQDVAYGVPYTYNPYSKSQSNIFGASDLQYAGSFARGFSVGNSQSLLLNSNFNLQLAGEIGEGIQIKAAISDDNIPIQPEGNTQVLQEFDQVFIEVSKGATSVVAGDYNLISPANYFMQYNKRLQGLSAEHTESLGSGWSLRNKASAAAARGKFARQTLIIQEGNQGPYKLQGNNGERFLIVLSGSERVYKDGILLKRGFEFDYVIDYNRAEISFTPTRLITKDDRIVVEFEYSDQSYLRTVYATHTDLVHKRGNLFFNFYSEQDSRSATGTILLDSTDLRILDQAGDDPRLAVRSGIRNENIDADDPNDRIRYRQDTVNGVAILVYQSSPEETDLVVRFSEVALGQGDYRIAQDLGVNGRVYEFVGRGEGNYVPNIVLVAPQQQRMLSMGGAFNWGAQGTLSVEMSLSQFDLNRLSDRDDQDNNGLGFVIKASDQWSLNDGRYQLGIQGRMEHVASTFNILNPYRDQEFVRDWNLRPTGSKSSERLGIANVFLKDVNRKIQFDYQYNALSQQGNYLGNKHVTTFRLDNTQFNVLLVGNVLNSRDNAYSTVFWRPKADVSIRLGSWRTGIYNEVEQSRWTGLTSDTLDARSFHYDLTRGFIETPQGEKTGARITASYRRDQLPIDGQLKDVSFARALEISQYWQPSPASRLNLAISARDLSVKVPDLVTVDPRTTLLGRLDYDLTLWNGVLRSTTGFNMDSGQEPKQEFVFIKLENADLGEYIYLGADGRGLDQSQFVFSPGHPQAFFRRASQFNNEFILTNNQGLDQSFRLDFNQLYRDRSPEYNPSALVNLIRRFALVSNIRLSQKRESTGEGRLLNVSAFNLLDSSLVSGNRLMTHTLFFNRGHAIYDIQLGSRLAENRFVQIAGAESRREASTFSRIRVNFKRYLDCIVEGSLGQRLGESEQFDNRDFDIRSREIAPTLTYRPSGDLRFSLGYNYREAETELPEGIRSVNHEGKLGCSYRRAATESLDAHFSIVEIDFNGTAGTILEFEMLDGLKNGRNFLWGLTYTRRLSNSIDLNINYEGTRTASPIIANSNLMQHVARAQVKATF